MFYGRHVRGAPLHCAAAAFSCMSKRAGHGAWEHTPGSRRTAFFASCKGNPVSGYAVRAEKRAAWPCLLPCDTDDKFIRFGGCVRRGTGSISADGAMQCGKKGWVPVGR